MRKRFPTTIVRLLLALALVAGLVAITAAPAGAAVTGVTVTASPSIASSTAGYTINFTTGADVTASGTVTVTFPSAVTLPSAISRSLISLTDGTALDFSATGDPDPVVSGQNVIVTIPAGETLNTGACVLTFSQAAGIVNPPIAATVASLAYPVTVVTSAEAAGANNPGYVLITPVISISPTSGPVGTAVTVTGKGFTPPTSATATLAGALVVTAPFPIPVASDGTLSATFTVPATASTGNVTVTDGVAVSSSKMFTVTPRLTLLPTSGMPGSTVTAIGTQFTATGITVEILFAGALLSPTVEVIDTNSDGTVTASFTVPATTPGSKVVMARNKAAPTEYGTALFTAGALPLTITPASGVSYTIVTIQGAGFTPSATITSILFGSTSALNISGSIDTSGGLTASCTVPALTAGTQAVTITDGTVTRLTTWTIPAASITLTPASGPRGTTVRVDGANFVPTETVTIALAGTSNVGTSTVSAAGTFSKQVMVPTTAVPGSNVAMASDTTGNTALATFTVPSASISLSPTSGYSGMTVQVTGTDFPAYSSVTSITFTRAVGGAATVTPAPAPGVDADGTLTASFRVPASVAGIATVVLTAGGVSGAATFTVSAAPSAPATVFAALEAANQLVRVWTLDAPTQTWEMYDPAAVEVSDLAQLVTGQGYYVKVTADCTLTYGVKTYALYQGWNLIGWLG